MTTETDISRAKSQFIELFEGMGLDPIDLGPDVDKTVRMVVAHGKAREREEIQHGKLLQFPSSARR